MANMSNAFYGGGHSMKSAHDLVYWCLRSTSVFYGPRDLFVPPKATTGAFRSHQRIATCADQAGVEMDLRYEDLLLRCQQNNLMLQPSVAIRTRGAILFNHGVVLVAVGDGRRVIYEEDYSLIMKYMNEDQNANADFEYAARVYQMEY